MKSNNEFLKIKKNKICEKCITKDRQIKDLSENIILLNSRNSGSNSENFSEISVESDYYNLDPLALLNKLILLNEEIKIDLKKLSNTVNEFKFNNIEDQGSDDILFYQSIITDSRNFLISSYKVRRNKIIFDINNI